MQREGEKMRDFQSVAGFPTWREINYRLHEPTYNGGDDRSKKKYAVGNNGQKLANVIYK